MLSDLYSHVGKKEVLEDKGKVPSFLASFRDYGRVPCFSLFGGEGGYKGGVLFLFCCYF